MQDAAHCNPQVHVRPGCIHGVVDVCGAGDNVQWEKALVWKSEELSLFSRTHYGKKI